jgi:beta-N-acetylhexosaminidase
MPDIASLSDKQLVGQVFTAFVYGSTATTVSPAQRQANLDLFGVPTGAQIVRRWHLGGVILLDHNSLDPLRYQLSSGNVDSAPQITALTAGLQAAARADSGVPLLIGTDQEGGPVQRITSGVAPRPAQASIAGLGAAALICSYRALGGQLRRLGVNQDYAPVADVVRTSDGIIGDRSFGPDPAVDARDVTAAATGLQEAGVIATLKHWPGHGSTSTDSHLALAVITESRAVWQAYDLPPFRAAAKVADSIMVGHLALPALDSSGRPATLSPVLVQGALRQGLGYAGLVITDSLWMAPAREAGSPGRVAELAILAGNDVLLETPDLPSAYGALLARTKADPTFRGYVQAAVRRILAAKSKIAGTAARPGGC